MKTKIIDGVSFNHAKVTRDIHIDGQSTLDELARSIVAYYGFDTDHLYRFVDDCDHVYEVSIDEDEKNGVNYVHVKDVFFIKKKLFFEYDLEDNWIFEIVCKKIEDPQPGRIYPCRTARKGKLPKQYPEVTYN